MRVAEICEWLILFLLKIPLLRDLGLRCYIAGETEKSALEMALVLHTRGYGVISDYLGEEAATKNNAIRAAKTYLRHIKHLAELKKANPKFRIAISIKLSQLGIKFDVWLAKRLAAIIFQKASASGVKFEIDMEGPETIDDTMNTVKRLMRTGSNFRVAIPANQSKAERCLHICLSRGIGVRIVKGAYQGDIKKRQAVKENVLRLVQIANDYYSALNCAIGTHDTALIQKAREKLPEISVQMLFGIRPFLKADWRYMPWGNQGEQFLRRRIKEGMQPNVIILFFLNFFESTLWRFLFARHVRFF